jgi:hypothetical protein
VVVSPFAANLSRKGEVKMFKVGDRVRLTENYPLAPFNKGDEGVVERVYNEMDGQYLVSFRVPSKGSCCCLNTRLELVSPASFNISTATDQELADEYRRNVNVVNDLLGALKDRGYTIDAIHPSLNKRVTIVESRERFIYKTEMKRMEI